MILKERITDFINKYLEGSDKFLVEIKVSPGDKISVFVDGERGITIDDCKMLTRVIESAFNRDDEDFDLTVSSAGADTPMKMPRQYPKHIGRTLEIRMKTDEIITGKLSSAVQEAIVLELPANKKEKQKQHTTIPFSEIKEGKVVLSFK